MKSHEFAHKMRTTAEFLLSRPEFETDTHPMNFIHFYKKEPFVAAVRALGAGKKVFVSNEIQFIADGLPEDVTFQIAAPRDTVCHLVRAAEYDCDSLLSPEEETALGEAAEPSNSDIPF